MQFYKTIKNNLAEVFEVNVEKQTRFSVFIDGKYVDGITNINELKDGMSCLLHYIPCPYCGSIENPIGNSSIFSELNNLDVKCTICGRSFNFNETYKKEIHTFPKGALVFEESNPADKIYIIYEGEV